MATKSKGAVDFNSATWLAAFERALGESKIKTGGDLARLGVRIQNAARRLCPVDTGRLRSSIMTSGLQRDGKGWYVEVGTNVVYAPHVEFGTRYQRAQAFLRPAFLEAAQQMRRGVL